MQVATLPPLTPRAALRWSVVRRLVRREAPGTILEIGCGQGAAGTRLARMADYTGVEPDAASHAVATARVGDTGTVIHGYHSDTPRDDYDLVCAFEVLEHIEDDVSALTDWVGLARPGGAVLLSVPADPDLFNESDVFAGHYRRYTAQTLRETFAAAGVEHVETLVHYGWPLGFALTKVRGRVAARRSDETDDAVPEELSMGSGRYLQPKDVATGAVIRAAVAPFALAQRMRPGTGEGILALARRPA
ncbi:class I SAM-dependent methyltransferase [Luteimicrobium subarcticum]|uniref:Methyltransferase family protein n=1 Tax=Luteimicrobium subarcticum TaxID=620910 RepID=A0A2M8W425_9MICO|nr:class I SAM-dependent methyltransferase [Luteimicrobium subarcticum]PJI85674.1 methyltransferase family protein [Luteimicrobium subarcticum]